MARFAVIMPASRPPRRPLEEPTGDLTAQRDALVGRLTRIYKWAKAHERRVQFAGDALAIVDAFAESIETGHAVDNERSRAMLQRLNAMTVKLAMLAAVVQPGADEHADLVVTPADAHHAVAVARRWRDYAIPFGERVGENLLEQLIAKARHVIEAKKHCPRRVVAQLVHCAKRQMDEIEDTLVDRGVITVDNVKPTSGRAATIWTVTP